jgi:hypothetical protein
VGSPMTAMAILTLLSGEPMATGASAPEEWLQAHCPTLWSLLKKKARTSLPLGIREYLTGGDQSERDVGQRHLRTADRHLQFLDSVCGSKMWLMHTGDHSLELPRIHNLRNGFVRSPSALQLPAWLKTRILSLR